MGLRGGREMDQIIFVLRRRHGLDHRPGLGGRLLRRTMHSHHLLSMQRIIVIARAADDGSPQQLSPAIFTFHPRTLLLDSRQQVSWFLYPLEPVSTEISPSVPKPHETGQDNLSI